MSETEPPRRLKRPFAMGCLTGGFLALGLEAFILIVGLLIARPYMADRAESRMKPPEIPNQVADFGATLIREDGEEALLNQWEGDVIVLTIWKPGCSACAMELPGLQRLAKRIENDEIQFLFVAWNEVERIDVEADSVGLEEPTYVVSENWPEVFVPRSVPATYVIAPDGRIVLTHVGTAKWDDPSVEAYLRELAVGPAPDTTDRRTE